MNARAVFHSLCAAASLLLIGIPHADAADDTASKGAPTVSGTAKASQQDASGQIYGSQLMTSEERAAYQQKMREAKTYEEREKLRAEHHEAMQARAKERGVTLPDVPPARGPGMGPGIGSGRGAGAGPGPGMGSGMGSGRGQGAGPGMGMGAGRGPGSDRGTSQTSP